MLRHVFGGRTIAAKRNATGLAGTQVHPSAVMFNTFFANMVFAQFYFFNSEQVGTKFFISHVVKIEKFVKKWNR